jgi:hypothetical protein
VDGSSKERDGKEREEMDAGATRQGMENRDRLRFLCNSPPKELEPTYERIF